LWQYIKPEIYETLNTAVNQNKTIHKSDEIYYNTTVNEEDGVDLFNGSLYSPVKLEDIKTRQTSSDDSLGISVRSSEPTAEVLIENVENGNVRNCISLMMTDIKLEVRKVNNIFLIILLLVLRGLRGHDRMVV
jgi:hypothetical protein